VSWIPTPAIVQEVAGLATADRWELIRALTDMSVHFDWGVDPVPGAAAGHAPLYNHRYFTAVRDIWDPRNGDPALPGWPAAGAVGREARREAYLALNARLQGEARAASVVAYPSPPLSSCVLCMLVCVGWWWCGWPREGAWSEALGARDPIFECGPLRALCCKLCTCVSFAQSSRRTSTSCTCHRYHTAASDGCSLLSRMLSTCCLLTQRSRCGPVTSPTSHVLGMTTSLTLTRAGCVRGDGKVAVVQLPHHRRQEQMEVKVEVAVVAVAVAVAGGGGGGEAREEVGQVGLWCRLQQLVALPTQAQLLCLPASVPITAVSARSRRLVRTMRHARWPSMRVVLCVLRRRPRQVRTLTW
jgi:hypothetical protein